MIYSDGTRYYTTPLFPNSSIDPAEIVRIFRSCLQVYGCIYSDMDQWNMIADHMTINGSNGTPNSLSAGLGLSWTSIKKKSQGIIVDKYIDREVLSRHLTEEQKIQLRSILSMGISLGFFNKENIIIENYDIKVINGLLFDEDTGRYSIDPSIKPKTKRVTAARKTTSTRPQTYGEKWISYHDSLSSLSTSPVDSPSGPSGSIGPAVLIGGSPNMTSTEGSSVIVIEEDNLS